MIIHLTLLNLYDMVIKCSKGRYHSDYTYATSLRSHQVLESGSGANLCIKGLFSVRSGNFKIRACCNVNQVYHNELGN